ncbi:hypothetical protein AT1219_20326 [Vibrio alginolyticus]
MLNARNLIFLFLFHLYQEKHPDYKTKISLNINIKHYLIKISDIGYLTDT